MKARPEADVTTLKGVGPRLQSTLAKLGIHRLVDLLLHLPFRYQDRSRVVPLRQIRAGDDCLFEGSITACQTLFGRGRSLKVTLEDGTGQVVLRFFHFSRYQQENLSKSTYLRGYGTFRFYGRDLTCAHPEYETFNEPPPPPEATLTPVYPTTQGLGQARLRSLADQVCNLDWPDDIGTPFADLEFLHRPPTGTDFSEIDAVREKIAHDELTAYYLVMKGRALERKANVAPALPRSKALGRDLLRRLGFKLTQAQARVVSEVLTDLEKPVPMLRLVQGDVGSGKTVVAAFAAIRAAEQNCQTAVMAPTELLAEQHHINFAAWLEPLGINVTLLTGQLSAAEQRDRLEAIENGSVAVIVGTHALFQDKVVFNNLALSIIDEQHRFGVHQRMALKYKGNSYEPHQLVMTATPIPRTLTMALYADMDVSVIDELPAGRQPITTHTVAVGRRDELVKEVEKVLTSGRQAYWVCTLIDESDEIDATAATTLFPELVKKYPGNQVALLHGRMKSQEKIGVMQAFKDGEIDLLVATTVIEVGVDVPNATVMVIENAERMGLAQLHQLRGRVGRGSVASHCYLLFSEHLSEGAKVRLTAMRDSQDGFYLAEQDLKLRGPGDILGTRQAGEQSFRIADLGLHAHLMPKVIERGEKLITDDARSEEMFNLLKTWAPADSGNLTV